MSVTYLQLKISNPQNPRKSTIKKFLVDSGAVYSVVPGDLLKDLAIKPIDKQRFILANGEEIEKELGEARFSFRGKERTAPVVFGEPNIFLLGATTLENLGLILDPINRELKPLPMLLMNIR